MNKFIGLIILIAIYSWWMSDSVVKSLSSDVEYNYLVEYPSGGGAGVYLPMLIVLHGDGGKAKNMFSYVLKGLKEPVRIILIKAPLPYSGDGIWPKKPETLKKYGTALNEAIQALILKYPTARKPLLLGYSGGGYMAFYQAIIHGDSYSYIFPISGWFNFNALIDQTIQIGAKVHAFNGKSDSVVGYGGGLSTVNKLKELGVDATLTSSKGGHQIIFYSMRNKITQLIDEKIDLLY